MTIVYIGVGTNLGDRLGNLKRARQKLEQIDNIRFLRTSAIYETTPVGGPIQPRYLNAVWEIRAEVSPLDLLEKLNLIESDMGRVRDKKNAPRIIDLDILYFGDIVMDDVKLTIPHPRLHQRAFVLQPLSDLIPDRKDPTTGKTVYELFKECYEKAKPASKSPKTDK